MGGSGDSQKSVMGFAAYLFSINKAYFFLIMKLIHEIGGNLCPALGACKVNGL